MKKRILLPKIVAGVAELEVSERKYVIRANGWKRI